MIAEAKKRITAKDVAEHAGVSRPLVSMYLSGNPKAWLSEETKRKIDEAVKTLGYRPNTLARALRSGRSHTIGLVMGSLANPGNSYLTEAIMNEVEKRGYRLFITVTRFDREREREALLQMLHYQIDGVIYNLSVDFESEFFRQFEHGEMPILLLQENPEFSLDCVYPDLRPGLRDAALHLAGQGYRRIFCQTGIHDHDREMVEDASRESGVPLEPFAWNPAGDRLEDAAEQIRRERPDALILAVFKTKLEPLAEVLGYQPRIIRQYGLPSFFYPEDTDGVIHVPFRPRVEKMVETLISRIENPRQERIQLGIPSEFLTKSEHTALFQKQCQDPYYQTYQ